MKNKWVPTADELRYEKEKITRQLNGFGPNGMRTRFGSGSGLLIGIEKPQSR